MDRTKKVYAAMSDTQYVYPEHIVFDLEKLHAIGGTVEAAKEIIEHMIGDKQPFEINRAAINRTEEDKLLGIYPIVEVNYVDTFGNEVHRNYYAKEYIVF